MQLKIESEREQKSRISLIDHLEELRYRLIKVLIALIICTIIAYMFKQEIFEFLVQPVIKLDIQFIHLKPYDKFLAYLKISLYTGIFLSIPILFYQMSCFIVPALYSNERKWFYSSIFFIVILFFLGSFLTYRYFSPSSLRFLIQFDQKSNISTDKNNIISNNQLLFINNQLKEINDKLGNIITSYNYLSEKSQKFFRKINQHLILIYKNFLKLNKNITEENINKIQIKSYLSTVDYLDWMVLFIILMGLVFQLPLLITLLAKVEIIDHHLLIKLRPYAFIGILIIAAIITPPDIFSQIIIGGPIYILYEISIFMSKIINKQKIKNN